MPMTVQQIRDAIHRVNPYDGFATTDYPDDVSGWGSHELFFSQMIAELTERCGREEREPVIVEVGTWKGASAIHMASLLEATGFAGGIVCVDTWLGALEFWTDVHDATRYKALGLKNGYPTVYYQFLANVVRHGVADRIVPFPVTSPIAARWFAKKEIRPDLVYIDASHDEPDVMADLVAWWPLVQGTGTLFGHDYNWVHPAVDKFAAAHGLRVELAKFGSHWVYRESA